MGTYTGTAGNDRSDLAPAGNPFEILDGLGGDDYLFADHTFSAANFDVTFYGGDGNDDLFLRNNTFARALSYGGNGNDWISGGNSARDEFLYGGADHDIMIGSFDSVATDGRDFMYGGSGSDRVSGGAGADYIYGGDSNDGFVGNITAGAVALGLATTASAGLFGGDGGDFIYGDAGNDELYGGTGDDYLYGGTGIDLMGGGAGSDRIFSDVNGTVNGGGMFGEAGDDFLYGGSGQDNMVAGDDNDQLYGGAANDYLYGQAGNDYMFGGDGVDVMFGGTGTFDVFYGGNGIDYILCDTENDTINFQNTGTTANQNIDVIYGFVANGGPDAIILEGFGAAVDTFQEVRDRAQYYAGLNTTIITLENTGGITSKAIWLVGVHVDQLTAGDFGFV